MSDLPRQKSNFPQNKEVQFSILFCSFLCIKYFLICKIKRYVIKFFVYKNRFLARQIGPVMAFIPDNISVHVHLLEDNDPIKKTKMAAVSWLTKTTRVFQRRSLLVYLCRFCRQRKVKAFSIVVLILEAAITFFLFKLQQQQCASLERCICIDI